MTLPNINRVGEILPTAVSATPYLPFPGFAQNMSYTTTDGDSYFYSIQAKYERRFSSGFNLLAAYTWGTVRDDVSDVLFSTLSYRAPYLPGFGIQGDYGLANFNVHNATHISGGYELPFGKGKHFFNAGGWMNAFIGGWRINGLLTLQSGTPITIGCTVSTTNGSVTTGPALTGSTSNFDGFAPLLTTSAAPEPGTWTLLGAGIAILAFAKKRSRRTSVVE